MLIQCILGRTKTVFDDKKIYRLFGQSYHQAILTQVREKRQRGELDELRAWQALDPPRAVPVIGQVNRLVLRIFMNSDSPSPVDAGSAA